MSSLLLLLSFESDGDQPVVVPQRTMLGVGV